MAGYARCSTDAQDLTPQLDVLTRLGVGPQRLYAGQGLTGTTRDRPGLREALAAVRAPRGHPGGRQTRPALPTEVDL
jgi:DNA invertase Pin-like site-specific DNA recombinase